MHFPASWAQDPICGYLLRGISSGVLQPGEKLPTERELCLQFGRPRGSVRKSLAILEGNGLIVRQVGRGTFVAGGAHRADGDEITAPALVPDISPAELIEARLALEPSVADLATKHATNADLRHIANCFERAKAALDHGEFERADRAFHLALGQATHNGLVLATTALIDRVRDSAEWGATKRARTANNLPRRRAANREHEAIVTAICQRDAGAARKAAAEHLLKVRKNLIGY